MASRARRLAERISAFVSSLCCVGVVRRGIVPLSAEGDSCSVLILSISESWRFRVSRQFEESGARSASDTAIGVPPMARGRNYLIDLGARGVSPQTFVSVRAVEVSFDPVSLQPQLFSRSQQ